MRLLPLALLIACEGGKVSGEEGDGGGMDTAGEDGASCPGEPDAETVGFEYRCCVDVETCHGFDDDYDGLLDVEDVDDLAAERWYPDADGDGYGAAGSEPVHACTADAPAGFVPNDSDCDDTDPAVVPGWGAGDVDCDGFAGLEVDAADATVLGVTYGGTIGRVLLKADLDQDGREELWLREDESRASGRLRGFPASMLSGILPATRAPWSVSGPRPSDAFTAGALATEDLDQDTIPDFIALEGWRG